MKQTNNTNNLCCLNASFTLEAAIIFPIILAVIFSILLLIFSLHDVVAAKNISYRYLISYSMQEQDIYKYNNNFCNIKNEFYKSSFLGSISDFTATFKKNNLRVTSSCYSIPTVFSNYNNTERLQAYRAGKILLTKSTD